MRTSTLSAIIFRLCTESSLGMTGNTKLNLLLEHIPAKELLPPLREYSKRRLLLISVHGQSPADDQKRSENSGL